jgi:hypothetical protein
MRKFYLIELGERPPRTPSKAACQPAAGGDRVSGEGRITRCALDFVALGVIIGAAVWGASAGEALAASRKAALPIESDIPCPPAPVGGRMKERGV